MALRINKRPGKPGPKPRGPFKDKRRTLTTRITERTRGLLEEAAENSDRSLSQEIEFRLEKTLSADEFLGGPAIAPLAKTISSVLQMVASQSGKDWRKDPDTYYAMLSSIVSVMDVLKPEDALIPVLRYEDIPMDEALVFSTAQTARAMAKDTKGTGS